MPKALKNIIIMKVGKLSNYCVDCWRRFAVGIVRIVLFSFTFQTHAEKILLPI